jgi:hypothetical protein
MYRNKEDFDAMFAYMELLERLPIDDRHFIFIEVLNVLQACQLRDMNHALELNIAYRLYDHFPECAEMCSFYARWLYSESKFLVS